jgi:hypothetical protein
MPKKAIILSGFLILITGLTYAFYASTQPIASYALEPRLDGNQYQKMFLYFAGETDAYQVSYPFHARILVPWLASTFFPEEVVEAFKSLNFIFTLLAVFSLSLLWNRLRIPLYLMGGGFCWLLFHWTGLIRLNLFDPITVDVPLYFLQTLFLIFIYNQQWKHLLWLGPLATLQKESFPALLLVLLMYAISYNRYRKGNHFPLVWIGGALLLSFLAKAMVSYFYPPLETGRSALITMLYHAREVIHDPFLLVRWLVATFTAFGGLLFLAGWQIWQDYVQKLWDKAQSLSSRLLTCMFPDEWYLPLLLLFSLAYFLLGLLAGGDFTRIIFLGFPMVMTLLLLCVRSYPLWLVLLAWLFSWPLMRLEGNIPDIGKTPLLFAEWYPEFAPVRIVLLWLGYAAGVAIVLGLVLILHEKIKHRGTENN